MSASGDFAPGDVIAGRYKVEAPLGEGGFGAVYRAVNQESGAAVAVKLLHVRHTARETEVKRFQREAALVTRLDHPNIVKTLDYGHTEDAVPFIVFELLDGVALKDKLKTEGAVSLARAGRIALQVLSALQHAHGLGIVHRDIKPANIFLCAGRDTDFARVLDFGIAKALRPENQNLTKLTATGQIIGTPHYMAPEQVQGGAIGPQADLYSFGLVLAEMLTGKKVVHASSDIEIMMVQMAPTPLPFSEAVLESPYVDVLRQATEKEVAKRTKSADEMAAGVEQVLAQLGHSGPRSQVAARVAVPSQAMAEVSPPSMPTATTAISVVQPVQPQVAAPVVQPAPQPPVPPAQPSQPTPMPYVAPPATYVPAPAAYQPPPARSSSGCVVAAIVTVCLVGLVGGGTAYWYFMVRSAISSAVSRATERSGPSKSSPATSSGAATPGSDTPAANSAASSGLAVLTGAEIKRRVTAAGWTIEEGSFFDSPAPGGAGVTATQVGLSNARGAKGSVVFFHYTQSFVAEGGARALAESNPGAQVKSAGTNMLMVKMEKRTVEGADLMKLLCE
jgi:serine/threonine protein kinase